MGLPMRPGEQLRELRNRLGVTTREVEEFSRTIAEDRQNEEFYISNAWLTQLENKNSIPSIYKLYSLSVIYRTKFQDLLGVFGIDLDASSRYQLALPLQNTHLASLESPDPQKAITFPVRFDKSFTPGEDQPDFAHGGSLGRSAGSADTEARCPAMPVRLHGNSGLHHVSAAASGVFRANRSATNQVGYLRMALGIRPADLFRGIAGRLRVLLVRGPRIADYSDPASALRMRDPAVRLSFRGGNYRAGNRGCHAAGAAGDGVCRRASKIAKAILKFENRKSAVSASVSTGTATR